MLSFGHVFRFGALMAIVASSAAVTGAVASVSPAGFENSTKVSGVARFVRHHTVTPLSALCQFQGCIQSKPYWALAIDSNGIKYEVNQQFALGQESAPELVQIGTVVIRPGSHLVIEADIEVLARDYAILTHVKNIEVSMDGGLPQFEKSDYDGAPFFGWMCRSIHEARPIYVDIEQVSQAGAYSMRVVTETGETDANFHTIATFDHLSLVMTDAAIGFSGSTQHIRAELDIDQRTGRFSNLDSVLRLSTRIRTAPRGNAAQTSVRLVCDRTR